MKILIAASLVGATLWIGGSIYGAIQIKSVQDRASDIEQQVERRMGQRTKEIDDKAGNALTEIVARQTAVVSAARDAIEDVSQQQKLARQKLDVDQLPDISQLKVQIEELKLTGGKLNLRALSLLSGRSVFVLFAAAVVSLIFSLIVVGKALFGG